MTNRLRIPPKSQAYLIASHDEVDGSFNVRKFAYDYYNIAGPWAYWRMEEQGLETRVDSSGNGHHLLIDTELLAPGEDFDRVAGKVGYAMEYVPHWGAYADETHVDWDGDEMGIEAGTGKFAIAFWFKPHLIMPVHNGWVEWYGLSYGLYMGIGFNNGESNAYVVAQTAGWMTQHLVTETAGIFAPDVWHHLIWQFDGTGLFLYVDNVLRDSDLSTDNGVNGMNWWYMGGVYENEMSIALDEFGIWVGTAFTEAERAALWNNGSGMRVC